MRSRWRQPGVCSSAVALSDSWTTVKRRSDASQLQTANRRSTTSVPLGVTVRSAPVSSSRTVSATPASSLDAQRDPAARGRARAQRQRLGGRRDQEDEAERQRERGGAPHRTRTGGPATEPERTLKVPARSTSTR